MSIDTVVKTKSQNGLRLNYLLEMPIKRLETWLVNINSIPFVRVEIVQIWVNVGELELQPL